MIWSRTRIVFIVLGVVLPIAAYVIPPPVASVDFQPLWYALHPARIPLWLIPIVSLFALLESRFVSLAFASCIVFWATRVWSEAHNAVAKGLSANVNYANQIDGWPLILFLVASVAVYLITPVPLVRQTATEEKVDPPTYQPW
jgi:hypothetical protein